jgi:hypothetical protein
VREGFLINPVVVDARTDITTQLLSDKGYAVANAGENGDGDAEGKLLPERLREEVLSPRPPIACSARPS